MTRPEASRALYRIALDMSEDQRIDLHIDFDDGRYLDMPQLSQDEVLMLADDYSVRD